MLGAIDLTAFDTAVTDVTAAVADMGPAVVGVAVAGLGFGLVIRWIRKAFRSATA